mmetsp:Transcript_32541/g.74349  ORF Transcript_32541/g.74349 Transcript_32541/m.74349 type:complete len:412 (-) Transcript_32541:77-1312(-)
MEFGSNSLAKREAQDIDDQTSSNSGSSKTRCPGGSEVGDGGEESTGWSIASLSPEAHAALLGGSPQAGGRPSDKDSSRGDPSEGAGSSEDSQSGHHAACSAGKDASYHSVGVDSSSQDRGQYFSLERHGPSRSLGSAGHPDACKPCAFYCYSLCGCRNGPDCIFCHLFHESKLRQRREEWKRTQREKRGLRRKAAREEAAAFTGFAEDVPVPSSTEGSVMLEVGGFDGTPMRVGEARDTSLSSLRCFPYTPTDAVFVVGSFARLVPHPETLGDVPRFFSVMPELPKGLHLDPHSGMIHGIPWEPLVDMMTYVVTARRRGFDEAADADVLRCVARFQVVSKRVTPVTRRLDVVDPAGPEEVSVQLRARDHAGSNLDVSWSPLQRPGALLMKTAMDAENDFADATLLAGLRWH